jgi:CheY-like chemotaxis protein/anti-sigma regulatory factor (Ser/Thr protein kinase)
MSHESDWNPEVVNINDTLSRVIRMMEVGRSDKTSIKLSLDPLEPKAYLDKHSLETALINLLLNAQESLPKGEGVIQVTVSLEHDADAFGQSMVNIAVMDTGIGMSESEQEKVFTPFFTTRAKDKGTGLGLSSVTELMDQVDGGYNLTSTKGRGSTFELHIPAYTKNVPECEEAVVQPSVIPRGNMELVLVVEDEAHVRSTIVEMLSQAQYKTLEASSIQQAKTLLSKRKEIALILSDILMPGGTGVDLLEAMETMEDSPEIILMTGFSYQRPNSINALVLNKPISMNTLLTAISKKIKGTS